MTFVQYLSEVVGYKNRNNSWRYGQTCSNVLFANRPDLFIKVKNADADPFYDDSKLDKFFEIIATEWDNRISNTECIEKLSHKELGVDFSGKCFICGE